MNIQDHVPSLETCKRRKELNLSQKSLYYWILDDTTEPRLVLFDEPIYEWEEDSEFSDKIPSVNSLLEKLGTKEIADDIEIYSAPLASETLDRLPVEIKSNGNIYFLEATFGYFGIERNYIFTYSWEGKVLRSTIGESLAEAAALMEIYLAEHNLLPNRGKI